MSYRMSMLPRSFRILLSIAGCFILSMTLMRISDRLFRTYISPDCIRLKIEREAIRRAAAKHSGNLRGNPSQMAERAFGVRLDTNAGRKTTLAPYPDKQKSKEKKP